MRALDALRRRPALWGATPVLFYGFDDLTRLQLDAIETLGRVVGAEVTVSLAYEPGRTAFAGRAATFHALAPLASEHRQLQARAEYYAPRARAALSHLERSLFEPDAARVDAGASGALLEGGGERAELELVAREIGALLSEGMAPEEIAVLRAHPGGAPGSARRGLRRGGDPVRAAAAKAVRRHRDRPGADRACCAACRQQDGSPAGELGDLLAWLRAPGLLGASSSGAAGRAPAGHSLRGAPAGHRQAAGGPAGGQRAAHGCLSAGQARALWEERHWRLETIDRLLEAQGRGRDGAARPRHARAAVAVLRSQARRRERAGRRRAGRGARARGRPARAGRAARARAHRRRSWPRRARASWRRSLERVEIVSGDGAAGAGTGAVAVLDPLALRARRVRALFVCGLQEGVFPAPRAAAAVAGRGGAPAAGGGLGAAAGRAARSVAGGRALPAVRGRVAPGGAAGAELARGGR